MLIDVVSAEPLSNYRLRLRFEDGVEGIVDLRPHLRFQGVFAPLESPEYFATAKVDPELGTVKWPNGADLDPDMLYARVTGVQMPGFG